MLLLTVATKPRHSFAETAFCVVLRYGRGTAKIPWVWKPDFASPGVPRQGIRMIFSSWRGNGSFWQIIFTFWREFVHSGKTRLARRSKFQLYSHKPCPGEEFFYFFLANPTPARINSKFSSLGCSSPHISPPRQGLVATNHVWFISGFPLPLLVGEVCLSWCWLKKTLWVHSL